MTTPPPPAALPPLLFLAFSRPTRVFTYFRVFPTNLPFFAFLMINDVVIVFSGNTRFHFLQYVVVVFRSPLLEGPTQAAQHTYR